MCSSSLIPPSIPQVHQLAYKVESTGERPLLSSTFVSVDLDGGIIDLNLYQQIKKQNKLCMFVAIYSTVVQKLMEFISPLRVVSGNDFSKATEKHLQHKGRQFPKRERLF